MFFKNNFLIYLFCIVYISINSFADDTKFRILHVMSYHQSWSWNTNQLQGFKDGFDNVDVEYKIVELDTKRDSNPKSIKLKVDEAKDIIKNWKPHLLYTNDDNAQKYLAQEYVGTSLPIVFSAVNRDPSEYNFIGAKNVTGIMEYEHFIPTINLLRSIKKDIKKIAVIVDSDPTWKGVMSRMRTNIKYVENLEISDWIVIKTFDEYKVKIKELENSVDAIALLGVFNIKDENKKDISYEKILKWTAINSKLPDFSFWESRVASGTLCAVTVSGYEQGFLAGEMAKKILQEGVSPHEISLSYSIKGEPMINLKRAKDLGLEIDVQLLLDNKIIKEYKWNE